MKSYFYKAFFDFSSNLLCVFDLEGNLIKSNPSWKQILGYGRKDLMGKKYQDAIHPDDYRMALSVFEDLKRECKIDHFICRFKDVDGQFKTFELRAFVKDDLVYVWAQDITDRITVDGLLRESDEKFRLFFNNAPLGLFHYNKDGAVTECNDSFVRIIGSSRQKLVGLNMLTLPDERVRTAIRSCLDGLETIHLEMEYESYTANKKTPVRLIFAPIISDECAAIGGIGIVEDISERIHSQQALSESKEKYQTLFEQAADGVLIGVDGGVIVDANQNMSLISGYGKEELVGQNITMLFSQKALHAKPFDYQSVLEGKVVFTERELTRKNGSVVTIEMKTKKLGDGRLFSSMRDVTQLKKAEEALKASEDRLKRVFDLNPYSILIVNADGYPLHANQAFYNLFGGHPSAGVSIFDYSVSMQLGIVDEMKKAREGETIRIPDFCYSSQGSGRGGDKKNLWIRMVIFPLMNMSGEVEMLILMHEDITEQYMLKEKLRHAEKMEAIGLLTGGIAHDFNNMLSGIMGGATMLSKHNLSQDAQRSLKLIMDSAERMADLTGKLLTFGRKDSHDFKAEDIHTVIRNAIEILKYSIDKKIDILCDFECEELVVKGNMSQLQNVFINLGINASHAMAQGGTLLFRTSVVDRDDAYLKTVPYDLVYEKYVKIEVHDTGSGIPSEYKNKIFEPFFTTKNLDEGAGLGLTTVYGTVKDHQGLIDFVSEVNQGSAFSIYLPFVSDMRSTPEPVNTIIHSGTGRVLLVEDEEIVREATYDMLEALGYTVITAQNGQEGLDRFLTEQGRIDLVILDMMMPKMNGKDCFKKIKAVDPGAKIILYSGYSDMDDVLELEKDGLCAFMKKPFSFAELSRVLKSCGF